MIFLDPSKEANSQESSFQFGVWGGYKVSLPGNFTRKVLAISFAVSAVFSILLGNVIEGFFLFGCSLLFLNYEKESDSSLAPEEKEISIRPSTKEVSIIERSAEINRKLLDEKLEGQFLPSLSLTESFGRLSTAATTEEDSSTEETEEDDLDDLDEQILSDIEEVPEIEEDLAMSQQPFKGNKKILQSEEKRKTFQKAASKKKVFQKSKSYNCLVRKKVSSNAARSLISHQEVARPGGLCTSYTSSVLDSKKGRQTSFHSGDVFRFEKRKRSSKTRKNKVFVCD